MATVRFMYVFRAYPTSDQKRRLNVQFGCSRFVYNYFLAKRIELYRKSGKSTTYNSQCAELTTLKKENPWLYQANAQSLQRTLKHLQRAYNNFFAKRCGYPKFKGKKSKRSFTVPFQNAHLDKDAIRFPKFSDGIKVVFHREIQGKPTSVGVVMNCAGQYHVYVSVERNMDELQAINTCVGVDIGIKQLATCSDGTSHCNVAAYRRMEKLLRTRNKSLSRKVTGSKNQAKEKLRIGRLYRRISDARADAIHKASRKIVDENQVIVLEDLNVAGMIKNRRMAKSIADVGMYELVRQITYKSTWAGRTLIKVGRFFPSSKTCSHCGFIVDSLPLKIRKWICPACNVGHDRDINAAKNILKEGLRLKASQPPGQRG